MDSSNLLFLGTKGTVVAIDKGDGRILWESQLKTAILSGGDRFVSILPDGDRVYAHTGGELFCLDAASGQLIWTNKLSGLGYDIASLAMEGVPGCPPEFYAEERRNQESERNSSSNAGD